MTYKVLDVAEEKIPTTWYHSPAAITLVEVAVTVVVFLATIEGALLISWIPKYTVVEAEFPTITKPAVPAIGGALIHVEIVNGYAVIPTEVLSAYLFVPLKDKTSSQLSMIVHKLEYAVKLYKLFVLSKTDTPLILLGNITLKGNAGTVSKKILSCTG